MTLLNLEKPAGYINRRNLLVLSGASLAALTLASVVPAESQAETVDGLFDNIPLEDHVMGDANAKVSIVEYASMTCGHCRAFHEEVFPTIKKDYIETGKVKFILRPFPFDKDRRGEAAFMLANCVPNNNYYPMIDQLFTTQQSWTGAGNPVPELLRMSKVAGMSEEDFQKCLANQELLNKIIDGRNKAVKDFDVKSTPTLFVNGEKLGDSTLETVKKAIEAAL